MESWQQEDDEPDWGDLLVRKHNMLSVQQLGGVRLDTRCVLEPVLGRRLVGVLVPSKT